MTNVEYLNIIYFTYLYGCTEHKQYTVYTLEHFKQKFSCAELLYTDIGACYIVSILLYNILVERGGVV